MNVYKLVIHVLALGVILKYTSICDQVYKLKHACALKLLHCKAVNHATVCGFANTTKIISHVQKFTENLLKLTE